MRIRSELPCNRQEHTRSFSVSEGRGSQEKNIQSPANPIHVVVPAYNPGEIIIDVIERARNHADTVVIVDDGCDAENRTHLECCSHHPGVSLLRHERNCGKGFALMTGIAHCIDRMRAGDYVLTMDSDGQHEPEDIAKFRALLIERTDVHFALGQRLDTRTMPVKSRIGNGVATALYRLRTGTSIQDTQTGMRLLSKPFAQRVYDEVRPGRYETEMDMLILAAQSLAKIDSVEIRTIYLDGNSATQFRALTDSWRVLARLMRYTIVSIASFVIDYLLFVLLSHVAGTPYLIANIAARVVSAIANFTGHKVFSFRSPDRTLPKAARYVLAVAVSLSIASVLLYVAVEYLGFASLIAKPLVDALVFLINFAVLSRFVFRGRRIRG